MISKCITRLLSSDELFLVHGLTTPIYWMLEFLLGWDKSKLSLRELVPYSLTHIGHGQISILDTDRVVIVKCLVSHRTVIVV